MHVVESRFEVLRNLCPNGLRRLVSSAGSKLPSWLLCFCGLKLFAWRVGVGAQKFVHEHSLSM